MPGADRRLYRQAVITDLMNPL